MKKSMFEYEIQVRDYELDSQGIVNNAVYQNYLEHTRHQFLKQIGLDFSLLHNQGVDPVVSKITIRYHQSMHSGDCFLSQLYFSRKGVRYLFDQQLILKNDQTPIISAMVEIVCLENGQLVRSNRLTECLDNWLKEWESNAI